MNEFLVKIIDALPVLLIALPAGWLGSWAHSYFSEKGKNLATKEDIQEITEKIEFVKNQFGKKHLRSKAYIERQIFAYDEICQLLNEIKKLSYKENEKIEFVDEYGSKVCKAKSGLTTNLLNKLDEHQIFTSPSAHLLLTELSANLYDLSQKEYAASLIEDVNEKRATVLMGWHAVRNLIDDAQFQIRRELIDE